MVKGQRSPQTLTVTANSPHAATLSAQADGWAVLDVRAPGGALPALVSGSWSGAVAAGSIRRRLSTDVVLFAEQLHALLNAGLTLSEALPVLQKGTLAQGWGRTVHELNELLKQGHPLSSGMATIGGFPSLLVALVKSAEQTSNLPEALARFIEHQETAGKVRHQVISVSLYPALLLVIGGAVLAFLMLYVVPRFAVVFAGMDDIPWSADVMVAWSQWLQGHGTWVFASLIAVVMTTLVMVLTQAGRDRLQTAFLSIQPFSTWLRTYHLARWYRTIGMLVGGGIPLPQSLELARELLPSSMMGGADQATHNMTQGVAPAESFVMAGMTTPVAEQLLKAGERSGHVGEMLERAARFHEVELTKSLDRTMRVFEPLVMTLIGLGVGLVVVLMYLPIFELASAIQ